MRPALSLVLLLCTCLPASAQPARILFVRGGAGTGGFLEGGADEQLSDIHDLSTAPGNHGWGQLHLLLRGDGHQVAQVVEGPLGDNTPVDLATLLTQDWDVLVFGSNNAEYSAADAQLLADWVCAGGAALFISDANWGTDWGDAPSSDQVFLDHFDLVMNQDKGTYALEQATGDFTRPEHPVLAGEAAPGDEVSAFDGEGVSPITVVDLLPGVDPVVLAPAEGQMKLNDAQGSGTVVLAGPDDGALVALEMGLGRVAGHFDRNTFFNENGAGTSLARFDNTRYARNLFAWLAGAGGSFGQGCPTADGLQPRLALSGCPRTGQTIELSLEDGPGGALCVLLLGLGSEPGLFVGPCPLLVSPILDPQIVLTLPGSGPGTGELALPLVVPPSLPLGLYTLQAFLPGTGPGGLLASTNGVQLHAF